MARPMRRRMAAKIGPMNMPPQRIAQVAIVLVVLVGGAAWWWRSASSNPSASSHETGQASNPPGSTKKPASRNSVAIARMDALMAACNRDVAAAFKVRALELRQKQDAPSQVAYALAVPLDPSVDVERMPPTEYQRAMLEWQDEIRAALLRAAALAPDDTDVLWQAATRCGDGSDCRAVQRALLAAEPDNMAVWLHEMAWARTRGDAEASRIAFERAAAATRYDIHAGATHEAMLQGYAGLAMPASCERQEVRVANAYMRDLTGVPANTVETGMLDQALASAAVNASVSFPPYSPIVQPCTPALNAAMTPALRESCKRIHTRLADGDTIMDQIFASKIMLQLTADSPESTEWRERYRRSRWLMEHQLDPEILSQHRIEDYADGEVPRMQATLQAAGRWPPPADWLPADENDRSLILTGHPPAKKKPDQAP